MNTFILISYFIIILAIGLYQGRGLHSLQDFSVAGKQYGGFAIFATLTASFIGGGFSLGNAENVYRLGLISVLPLLGVSIQYMYVAKAIAPHMTRYSQAISIGDIIFKHYGKTAQIFTGLFSGFICIGILGVQLRALGYIFATYLNIAPGIGVILGSMIILAYTYAGGMKSVVATDILQFILLIIAMPLTLFLACRYLGGFNSLISRIPPTHLALPQSPSEWSSICSTILLFMCGELLVPPYITRLLLTTNKKALILASTSSALISIPYFLITGTIGLLSYIINPNLNPNLALPYIVKTILPQGINALVIAGLISIIMSTADSFLNSAVVSLLNDAWLPLKHYPTSSQRLLRPARMLTIAITLMSMFFALRADSVIHALSSVYMFWAPALPFPLIAAIKGYKISTARFMMAAAGGLIGCLIWQYLLQMPGGWHGAVIGLFINGFICIFPINKAQ